MITSPQYQSASNRILLIIVLPPVKFVSFFLLAFTLQASETPLKSPIKPKLVAAVACSDSESRRILY